VPDPEVLERPTRRRFTAEYKARILRQADEAKGRGTLGALLRREGLFSSHLGAWRKQLIDPDGNGLRGKRRGPEKKEKPDLRTAELERELKKTQKRLAKAEIIIAFQKKMHEILGIPLKTLEIEDD
jgi:transposase-like protein